MIENIVEVMKREEEDINPFLETSDPHDRAYLSLAVGLYRVVRKALSTGVVADLFGPVKKLQRSSACVRIEVEHDDIRAVIVKDKKDKSLSVFVDGFAGAPAVAYSEDNGYSVGGDMYFQFYAAVVGLTLLEEKLDKTLCISA